MYLMGCPSSFLSLYGLSCSTQATRKKEKKNGEKNGKTLCDAMHLSNIEKKEKNDFFCFSIEKNRAKGKGWWGGIGEREKRQSACTNHVLERLARALSMPL